MKHLVLAFTLASALYLGSQPLLAQTAAQEAPGDIVPRLLLDEPGVREDAIDLLVKRGNPDVTAALIQVMRFVRDRRQIDAALAAITEQEAGKWDWHEWMLWQQAHPDIKPFDGFDRFKADIMAALDPNFRVFLYPGVDHEIRLEEITWGGVVKDGIPALTNPTHITPLEAAYLTPDEPVFGVAINGDARAYPLRILDWHEMFNDVVGGQPVSLAYCTLCGSGILYKTGEVGDESPTIFGSSGFLYRSNKLMYDQKTKSLWNQFTGRPVVGELTGSGVELEILPVAITSWSDWLEKHPETKVLSLNTGFNRDYSLGRPYGEYFASANLMFPALVDDKRLEPKDYVYAVRVDGLAKAWPLTDFEGGKVVNDRIGDLRVTLIGDAESRTVRAYVRDDVVVKATDDPNVVLAGNRSMTVDETGLIGDDGAMFERLPGHIAYWFAWQGFIAGGPLAQAE